ncbi:hypothetical protein [Williamwhitmania taraxaci]|uniref:Uncharacterized protein n=1 Tax=Williamwhitmania taraxaci TaxID=1640674 RepID=A0A1G6H418_9BACT|nr:hypothetical protein [Williamwhitmania taraxaci]SDB88838.1 hypothetical protein SAMN05216323_100670 [Williamwhitmania taraxaci]
MPNAKKILSYLLIALVLSLSVKFQGNAVSEIPTSDNDRSAAFFSVYGGVNSLFIQPTEKSTSAQFSSIDLRANFLLRRIVALLPTVPNVATESVAQSLSFRECRVAYVIYPFHDFP